MSVRNHTADYLVCTVFQVVKACKTMEAAQLVRTDTISNQRSVDPSVNADVWIEVKQANR